jgi:hypothetical protein
VPASFDVIEPGAVLLAAGCVAAGEPLGSPFDSDPVESVEAAHATKPTAHIDAMLIRRMTRMGSSAA